GCIALRYRGQLVAAPRGTCVLLWRVPGLLLRGLPLGLPTVVRRRRGLRWLGGLLPVRRGLLPIRSALRTTRSGRRYGLRGVGGRLLAVVLGGYWIDDLGRVGRLRIVAGRRRSTLGFGADGRRQNLIPSYSIIICGNVSSRKILVELA